MTVKIGQPLPRIEDARLLTGRGRYSGDLSFPDQAWAVFVRSPHAHAAIGGIETRQAASAPGVLGVFTTDDIGDELGSTAVGFKRSRPDGTPIFWRAHPGLAKGRVRHVGDPLALVIARTAAQARDAAEWVEVNYSPLDSVTDMDRALRPDSPRVWQECPDNVSHVHMIGDAAATDAAFACARHVVRRRYVVSRVYSAYLEPRAAIAQYDPLDQRYTLYCDVQTPHRMRGFLAEEILRVPESRVRVVANDIGGAFGGKGHQAVEHRLILWAARRLGCAVKWQSERGESLLADEHGRDNIHEAELALDANGGFLALRAHWIANVGAYVNSDRNIQSTFVNTPGIVGVYGFPTACVRFTCVMTNTMSLAPFRGAGRPEATYVLERLIDDAARELGMDRLDLRRRNLIPPSALPMRTPLGFEYDCGEFERCMDHALALADVRGCESRRADSAKRGVLRGVGIANPIERAGSPGLEYAEIRFDAAGRATVLMGTKNQGQGHETTYAQILAARLSIDPRSITFIDGDTDRVAAGGGTFGSRSASLGGSALVIAADRVIDKGRRVAAHLLETAEADIAFEAGKFNVAGTDRAVTLSEVLRACFTAGKLPASISPGMFETGTFCPPDCTFPYGTHVCEVEVDPETGVVRIDRYTVVDDVGTVINPLLVKGQIHGGVAQGAGQVLFEQLVYDPDSGQVITGSFMDYAMPRADNFCDIVIDEISVPTARNPLGVKGAGEAGAVGALPAVMNAVMDALALAGVRELDMPATPDRVWRAIRDAAGAAGR